MPLAWLQKVMLRQDTRGKICKRKKQTGGKCSKDGFPFILYAQFRIDAPAVLACCILCNMQGVCDRLQVIAPAQQCEHLPFTRREGGSDRSVSRWRPSFVEQEQFYAIQEQGADTGGYLGHRYRNDRAVRRCRIRREGECSIFPPIDLNRKALPERWNASQSPLLTIQAQLCLSCCRKRYLVAHGFHHCVRLYHQGLPQVQQARKKLHGIKRMRTRCVGFR